MCKKLCSRFSIILEAFWQHRFTFIFYIHKHVLLRVKGSSWNISWRNYIIKLGGRVGGRGEAVYTLCKKIRFGPRWPDEGWKVLSRQEQINPSGRELLIEYYSPARLKSEIATIISSNISIKKKKLLVDDSTGGLFHSCCLPSIKIGVNVFAVQYTYIQCICG